MNCTLRLASVDDAAALEKLIEISVRGLQAPYYSSAQMEAALGPIFGVDLQLIADGTYYVAEVGREIVGCGGWSRRKALFGGGHARSQDDALIDPATDRARIRAFFIHPDRARLGVAKRILAECERALSEAGFSNVELVATLSGEPFYLACGYRAVERFEAPMAAELTLPVVRMRKEMTAKNLSS